MDIALLFLLLQQRVDFEAASFIVENDREGATMNAEVLTIVHEHRAAATVKPVFMPLFVVFSNRITGLQGGEGSVCL